MELWWKCLLWNCSTRLIFQAYSRSATPTSHMDVRESVSHQDTHQAGTTTAPEVAPSFVYVSVKATSTSRADRISQTRAI